MSSASEVTGSWESVLTVVLTEFCTETISTVSEFVVNCVSTFKIDADSAVDTVAEFAIRFVVDEIDVPSADFRLPTPTGTPNRVPVLMIVAAIFFWGGGQSKL